MLAEVPHLKAYSWDDVIAIANAAKGDDPYGYRAEMVALARLAKSARR
jgi:Ca-activated chloride channel family protein